MYIYIYLYIIIITIIIIIIFVIISSKASNSTEPDLVRIDAVTVQRLELQAAVSWA